MKGNKNLSFLKYKIKEKHTTAIRNIYKFEYSNSPI